MASTKMEIVGVRLEAHLMQRVRDQAAREHRSISNLCAKIILEWCEAQSPQKPKANGHDHRPLRASVPQS